MIRFIVDEILSQSDIMHLIHYLWLYNCIGICGKCVYLSIYQHVHQLNAYVLDAGRNRFDYQKAQLVLQVVVLQVVTISICLTHTHYPTLISKCHVYMSVAYSVYV